MSKTLFWYVFKDLLKVFLLASGVIAAIMSFGGLFRSLTENGLDAGQVMEVIAYLMPAMTTYSYPVAALFATAVVYGRLAADNEVTAVRAAGISLGPLGLGLPAVILGILVAFMSVGALSYVVPGAALRVERTVFSNLAQLVANRIEQQHNIKLQQSGGALTIYARSADMVDPKDAPPGEQVVTLSGVSIVTFVRPPGSPANEKSGPASDKRLQVPDEFYMAQTAVVSISQKSESDPVMMRAVLTGGSKFPRDVLGRPDTATQGSFQTQNFGPVPLPSPIKENTRFMNISGLQELHRHPERSRRIGDLMEDYVRVEQRQVYLRGLRDRLTGSGKSIDLQSSGEGTFTLICGSIPATIERSKLVLTSAGGEDRVQLVQSRPGNPPLEVVAREARLIVTPINDSDAPSLSVVVELLDPVVKVGETLSPRVNFERKFELPLPENLALIAKNATAQGYLTSGTFLSPAQTQQLQRNLLKQQNSVISEMHARGAFAFSCLVLVMVGYALGVRFKSGNYLTAFAVSVAPALLSIVLIVTGQHVAENVPWDAGVHFKNPLNAGLLLIWSGNAAVLTMATVLMVRLRRT